MFKILFIKLFVCLLSLGTIAQLNTSHIQDLNYVYSPNDSGQEFCFQMLQNGNIDFQKYDLFSEFASCFIDHYDSEIINPTATNSSNNKFCMLTVRKIVEPQSTKRMFPISSVCLPTECGDNGLNIARNDLKIEIDFCHTSSDKFVNRFGFILAISTLFTVIAASFVGTILHYTSRFNFPFHLNPIFKCLRECFNLKQNFESLISIDTRKEVGKQDLRYLNGINVLLILITVIVHCVYFLNVTILSKVAMFSNTELFYRELENKLSFVSNGIEKYYIIMGWFFLISGFVVTYSQLSSKATLPDFLSYALNRWLRLIPPIIATIFLTILTQKFGSGPFFHEKLTDVYVKPCYDKWWTHLLMINNFWTWDQMCGINLWYSAANFQLCLLLYPILWLCNHKSYSLAYITSGLLGFCSFIFPVFAFFDIAGIPRYDSGVRPEYSIPFESFRHFYTSPLIYLFPFFIGATTAIYIFNASNHRQISWISTDLIASILLASTVAIAFWPISENFKTEENVHRNMNYIWIALFHYSAFNLMAVGFILLASISGKSFIKNAFSLNIWQVMSKLSYGIYLSNLLLIWNNVHRKDEIQTLTTSYILQTFSLIYAESTLMAVLLFVFVEVPFKNLTTFMTQPKQSDANESAAITSKL